MIAETVRERNREAIAAEFEERLHAANQRCHDEHPALMAELLSHSVTITATGAVSCPWLSTCQD